MFDLKIDMYTTYDELDLRCTFNLGSEDMVQSFFSTIAYRLENNKWGSVYPVIMNEFYKGKLEQKNIIRAIVEIKEIKKRLQKLEFSQLIWNIEDLNIKTPENYNLQINLDEWFINNNRERITDKILTVLKLSKNKNFPLYIGKYYSDELDTPESINIINKTQKNIKIKKYLKYIFYLLIVLIIKQIANEAEFLRFIKIFIFSMIVSELIAFDAKQKIDAKKKQFEQDEELHLKSDKPKMIIEKITIKRDLRSGIFDKMLDEMNFSKSYTEIKEKLKLKRIKNWKSDIEKIYQELNYNSGYTIEIIEYLEQFDELKIYELKDISKIIPKEKRYNIYEEDNIYRIIENNKEMYIITFKK